MVHKWVVNEWYRINSQEISMNMKVSFKRSLYKIFRIKMKDGIRWGSGGLVASCQADELRVPSSNPGTLVNLISG